MLNQALTKEQTTTVLLETMAGKGTEVGRSFEELKAIIDGVEIDEKDVYKRQKCMLIHNQQNYTT